MWLARALRTLGFASLEQVDEALRHQDPDAISRRLHGNLQGQLTRFEEALFAAMGEHWVKDHPFARLTDGWWVRWQEQKLERMTRLGIDVGDYSPKGR